MKSTGKTDFKPSLRRPLAMIIGGSALLVLILSFFFTDIIHVYRWIESGQSTLEQVVHHQSKNRFFQSEIEPLLQHCQEKDEEAVRKAVAMAEDQIEAYAQGIENFVKDMISLSTRFGAAGRWISDSFKKYVRDIPTSDLSDYVAVKFHEHIVSPQVMEHDLTRIVSEFAYQITANQNTLMASVQQAAVASQLDIDPTLYRPGVFDQALLKNAINTERIGMHSVSLLGVDTAVMMADLLTTSIAAALLSAYGSSWTGPLSLGIGMVVGVVTDLFGTSQIAEGIRTECRKALTRIGHDVIHDPKFGLKAVLINQTRKIETDRHKLLADMLIKR